MVRDGLQPGEVTAIALADELSLYPKLTGTTRDLRVEAARTREVTAVKHDVVEEYGPIDAIEKFREDIDFRAPGGDTFTIGYRGNYPEHCSLEGATFSGLPTEAELAGETVQWVPLLPQMPLAGDTQNRFPINYQERITHLRFRIFPDGGVARLRVYGEVVPDWDGLKRAGGYVAGVSHQQRQHCAALWRRLDAR